jgi:hypothetical protein
MIMKSILFLLLLLASGYNADLFRYHRNGQHSPPSSGKYRISPKTGLRIALPSKFIWVYALVVTQKCFVYI